MGLLNNREIHRCHAFTLIESVVAIIVVMICFWLSTMIYVNITRSDARMDRLKSFSEVRQQAVETHRQKCYFDEETTVDSLYIKKVIEPYQNDPNLKILSIEAQNSKKKKIAVYKQIIIVP